MPYYPYRCLNCQKRFEIFLSYSEYGTVPVQCPHCNSVNVTRRIGRVRFARSMDNRLDDLTSSGDLDGLEDDPKAMGRMMREMSAEMGEEMGPEFDEVVNRLEAGQSPEEIEKALPDLGEGSPGLDDGDADF